MNIVSYQIDSTPSGALVHFAVVGTAVDGVERLGRFSVAAGLPLDETTVTAWLGDYLATNAAAVQAEIDAGVEAGDSDQATAAGAGAKQWYVDHPNAALLFDLSIDDLDAAIQNRSAAAETLLLKTLAIAVRVLAKREGLV